VRDTSRSDTEPSLSARLVHRLTGSLELSASVARTTRAPDPRERYFGLKRKGADWVGNPTLEPPRSTGGELGLTWSGGGGVLAAALWMDSVADYITLYGQPKINGVPGVMNSTAQSYANVDALLHGASVDGTAALSSRFYLAGNLSWVRGTKDTNPGLGLESDKLAEMPPLTGRLALRWQKPTLFFEVEGLAAAAQDEVDADLSELETPGWAILNLRAGWSSGSWRVRAALENVLDRTYREHFSSVRNPYRSGVVVNEPGRSFTVMLGWTR
jgi:iron complex outermembrane receptor protein